MHIADLLPDARRFPQTHVYNVVSNVGQYQHFVPWCVDSTVLLQRENYMEAELAVGFNVFAERYVSKVSMEPERMVIARARDTQLFHYLTNEWTFAPGPNPQSTWIAFSVDFQFRSILYAQASHLFFDEVVNKMVVAFERRCGATWTPELARSMQQQHASQDLILPARGLQHREPVKLSGPLAPVAASAGAVPSSRHDVPLLTPVHRTDVARVGTTDRQGVPATLSSAQVSQKSKHWQANIDSRQSVPAQLPLRPASALPPARTRNDLKPQQPPLAPTPASSSSSHRGRPAPPLPGTISIW